MEGCARSTCFSAGQNVSQRLFPHTDWRRSPEIAQEILLAFHKLKEIFPLIWMLQVTHFACPDGPEREYWAAYQLAQTTYHARIRAHAGIGNGSTATRQSEVDLIYSGVTQPAGTD